MSINLSAPINSLGYGYVGLNIAIALERIGASPALWPIGPIEAPAETHDFIRRMIGRQASYDPKAPSLRLWHQFALAEHVGKGPHIGMPIFELNRFRPVEQHHLLSQDLLVATSKWAKDIFLSNGIPEERIILAPLGVDHNLFRPRPAPQEIPETVFLNMGKWEIRKGHDILANAFCAAFTAEDNVRLLMHCHNPCAGTEYNAGWEQHYQSCDLANKIFVSRGRLESQRDIATLMSGVDCGVFPSRAEGWGMESCEMLAMGKSVILTDYSGHTEYARPDNSLLIKIDSLEDAHDGVWFHADAPDWNSKPGQWAHLGQNQFDQLVEYMRSIHRQKQAGLIPESNSIVANSVNHLTWDSTAKAIISGAK